MIELNDIGMTGAIALADALKVNKRADVINLSKHNYIIGDNRIGPIGTTAIADTLKFYYTINELNLSYNK